MKNSLMEDRTILNKFTVKQRQQDFPPQTNQFPLFLLCIFQVAFLSLVCQVH